MTLRILATVVAIAVTTAVAQTPAGEIGGRVSVRIDGQSSVTPGVSVRIMNGGQSRQAVTDRDGRFVFGSLTMGTYRVVAELAGFKTASGEITLSSSTPRALLAWSLEVGCLAEVHRIRFGPRDGARLVEAIVHIRVATAAGPTLMSSSPDCEGMVFHEYSVQVLGSAPGRSRTSPGPRLIFMEPPDARLTPGQEYLALLWPDGYTTHDLVLPIVAGRVASPSAGELNGLAPNEALNMLARWSKERQR